MLGGASSQDIPYRSFMRTSFIWSQATYVEGGWNAYEQISRPPSSNTTSFHQHQRCRCSQQFRLWKLLQIHILIKIRPFSESNVSEPNARKIKIIKKKKKSLLHLKQQNVILSFLFIMFVLMYVYNVHTYTKKREFVVKFVGHIWTQSNSA